MVGDHVDRDEDRLQGLDPAALGTKGVERDQGLRNGMTTDERARLKALEREVRALRPSSGRWANEILRKASAYFVQAELDRRSRT